VREGLAPGSEAAAAGSGPMAAGSDRSADVRADSLANPSSDPSTTALPAGLANLDGRLSRLWDVVAARLQRNGLVPRGTVQLDGITTDERRALAGLLGRPVTGTRARVSLERLDDRLRVIGVAPGLVAAAGSLRGPLVDRPANRRQEAARRAAVWAAGRDALVATALAGEVWVEPWLAAVRSAGTLSRLDPDQAERILVSSVRCLAKLPVFATSGAGESLLGRGELATEVAGSSHALDDGSVLAATVLRAVALALDVPRPLTAIERRSLWARCGVLVDEVSDTVLTFGLRPPGDAPVAVAVRARTDAGCESHLSLRDLRRVPAWMPAGGIVYVCENPRVLEAAMDAGSIRPVVCTSGNPTVVVDRLLAQLAAGMVTLYYRGDFDWPGLAIANRVASRHGCFPWRMAAGDYEAALAAAGPRATDLPLLEGKRVDAAWDSMLSPAMERAGRVIHEEALLDTLVGDLLEG